MIRKLTVTGAAMAVMVSVPAQALGVGDLAKVVLGNGATVQKAAETCPTNKFSLTSQDSLTMQIARAAAEKALPQAQFLALDNAATTQATTQAAKPGFCNTTAKKKSGLLEALKKAGQQLITARVLGL
jgi:antitoxin component of RelBE/YafQ-DinJ toxin-antitoxin module